MSKKCRECEIELTEENRVGKEYICKPCQKIKLKLYRERIRNNEPPPPKEVIDKCSKCNVTFNEENRCSRGNQCKTCVNEAYKKYIEKKAEEYKNPEIEVFCSKCSTKLTPETQIRGRRYCRPCANKQSNEYKRLNKEKVKAARKIYYEQNKETISEYYKEHYENNKEAYLNNNRKWREENKKIINEKERARRLVDANYRLRRSLRARLHDCIKKDKPTMEYIGCDLDFLKEWLQSLFTEDMTFDNYGSYWHVDHVIPCSKFDLTDEDNVYNCFRWTNLQPLKASENLSKSGSIDSENIKSHYKKVKSYAKEHNITLPKFNYKKYITTEITI